MNKIFETLENVLKQDERFVSQDGKVMRNAVYEAANKMDEKLLSLLISNDEIKKVFFKEINGMFVFDKQEFNFVINNRELLPDSYTRFKQKIGLIDSKNDFLVSKNDVVLSFPFKDCILEFDSTDPNKDRKEIFFNETLAHDEIDNLLDKKVFTNTKLIDESGEKEIEFFDEKSNLLIKGNNLLAMYSLLPRYRNQVKLMYWDILYNTDSDHVPYNDSFKHSSWLTMMKNRLDVAKKLLREDGIICLQCDDNEVAYLKVLCDEIFERKSFVSQITCKVSSPGGLTGGTEMFFNCAEYILIYSLKPNDNFNVVMKEVEIVNKYTKTANGYKRIFKKLLYPNKQYVGEVDGIKYYVLNDSDFKIETVNTESMEEKDFYNLRNELFSTTALSGGIGKKLKKGLSQLNIKNDLVIYEYIPSKGRDKGIFSSYMLLNGRKVSYLKNYINVDNENKRITKIENVSNIISDDWWNGISSEGNVKLNNGKKPEVLVKLLLDVCTNSNDIILDSYFGSGTTGAVAIKMGRRFIGIEQLDSHIKLAKTRLKNVIDGDETGISKQVGWQGGGSFIYCEFKKLNQDYIDKIKSINDKKELAGLAMEILHSDFISCNIDIEKVVGEFQNIEDLEIDDLKKILIELLDKNQLYVNYNDIDDEEMKVSNKDKKFTKSFYGEE